MSKAPKIEVYSPDYGGIIATATADGWDDEAQQPLWEIVITGEVSAGQLLAIARRIAYASINDGIHIEPRTYCEMESVGGDSLAFRGNDLLFGIPSFEDDGFGEGDG